MSKITVRAAAVLLAMALNGPAHAAGIVEVNYVEPAKFADIGRNAVDRERVLKSMSAYLQKLGQQLPDGQLLKLDVLDIDLAGELRPWGAQEIRVLRGRADWPHMTMRYILSQGGTTLKSGEARLADMNYMQSLHGAAESYGDLGYEKRMVQQWFAATFGGH